MTLTGTIIISIVAFISGFLLSTVIFHQKIKKQTNMNTREIRTAFNNVEIELNKLKSKMMGKS